MPDKKAMIEALSGYLKHHPEEILRAARGALSLRFGLPLAALRWLAAQPQGKKAPKNVLIEAVPPGIRFAADVDAMGTSVRASAIACVESVILNADEMRFEVRLSDVSLKVLDETAESPVAALIKSGALDLSKPGNLAAYMPKRPPVLVEAADDRITIDLMKHPKLAKNRRIAKVLGLVTPLVSIGGIQTDWEHLDVLFRAFPEGFGEAVFAVRRAL
jgi:hypothetical protein